MYDGERPRLLEAFEDAQDLTEGVDTGPESSVGA